MTQDAWHVVFEGAVRVEAYHLDDSGALDVPRLCKVGHPPPPVTVPRDREGPKPPPPIRVGQSGGALGRVARDQDLPPPSVWSAVMRHHRNTPPMLEPSGNHSVQPLAHVP
eukprot:CAMPEP_0172089740 /NCGR_PEP_ID=MMETSP1043-20130122/23973_1 /TAXON_ID=464988 /ORGANISM="Hemiselmis andersenii, Strain CCMP441" /LENGTH=110 /DNA_ID=CAMNT_0012752221 /DNA_START=12 /DNA_END=345 /DNA_ORIENTATION=+